MSESAGYSRGNRREGESDRGRGRGRGFSNRGRGFPYWKHNKQNRWKQKSSDQDDIERDSNAGSGGTPSGTQHSDVTRPINAYFLPISSPYKGWEYYFPLNDYTPNCRISQQVDWFTDYIKRIESEYDINTIIKNSSFIVDYTSLIEDNILLSSWPNLKDDLYNQPHQTIDCLSLAMHQIITDKVEAKQQNHNLTVDQEEDVIHLMKKEIPFVRARLVNFKPITQLKDMRSNLYGKLIAITGMVIRSSNRRPHCLALAFKCDACSEEMVVPQYDGKYEPPTRCIKDTRGSRCIGNRFEPLRNSPKNRIVEWQSLRIQENNASALESGRVPRTIDCEVTEDLVGSSSPGEAVIFIGVVKANNVVDPDQSSKGQSLYEYYLEGVSLQNLDRNSKKKTESEDIADASCSAGPLDLSIRDFYAIRKIHEEPNLFSFLVASLCPRIFGNELVKAGLLLSLFGGSSNEFDPTQGPFSKRSDVHVLIVGDPGLGKSQMLHACAMASPRGVYVCGNSTTNSGLTVTLTRDGTNGNEYTLEAGALVLGDQGTCCIDELDKMSCQYEILLETMEQQSISIAKSGVVCTLPARTSILAAANPVGGHYDRSKTVSENIKLSAPLLSRFDLVFLLLDRADMDVDAMIAYHISDQHMGKNTHSSSMSSYSKSTSFVGSQTDDTTLKSRLRVDPKTLDLLPIPLLRKYVAYARKYVHPTLENEAKKEILQFYLQLRSSSHSQDSTPITARQLESLVRLTQAKARAELRETATVQDARDVIELVKTSFDDVYRNEHGTLDFTRSMNGSGMSSRNEGKKFVAVLQSHSNRSGNCEFTFDELRGIASQISVARNTNFKDFLEKLNIQGYLLRLPGNKYKLVI